MSQLSLGIEIGGTKLQVGVGIAGEPLRALTRAQVDASLGAPGIRDALIPLVAEALTTAGITLDAIAHIGIGFGGPAGHAARHNSKILPN